MSMSSDVKEYYGLALRSDAQPLQGQHPLRAAQFQAFYGPHQLARMSRGLLP